MQNRNQLERDDLAGSSNPYIRTLVANRYRFKPSELDEALTSRISNFNSLSEEIKTRITNAWQQGCGAPVSMALQMLTYKLNLILPGDAQCEASYDPETGELTVTETIPAIQTVESSTGPMTVVNLNPATTTTITKLSLVQIDSQTVPRQEESEQEESEQEELKQEKLKQEKPEQYAFELLSIETNNAYLRDVLKSGRLPDITKPEYKDHVSFSNLEGLLKPISDFQALLNQGNGEYRFQNADQILELKSVVDQESYQDPIQLRTAVLAKLKQFIKLVQPDRKKLAKNSPFLNAYIEAVRCYRQLETLSTQRVVPEPVKKLIDAVKACKKIQRESKLKHRLTREMLAQSENPGIQMRAEKGFYIIPSDRKIFDTDRDRRRIAVTGDEAKEETKLAYARSAWTQACNAVVANAIDHALAPASSLFAQYTGDTKINLLKWSPSSENMSVIDLQSSTSTAFESKFVIESSVGVDREIIFEIPGAEVEFELVPAPYVDYVQLRLMNLVEVAEDQSIKAIFKAKIDVFLSKGIVTESSLENFLDHDLQAFVQHLPETDPVRKEIGYIQSLSPDVGYPVFRVKEIRTDSDLTRDILMQKTMPDVNAQKGKKYKDDVDVIRHTNAVEAVTANDAIRESSTSMPVFTLTQKRLTKSSNPEIKSLAADSFFTMATVGDFKKDFNRAAIKIRRKGVLCVYDDLQPGEREVVDKAYSQSLTSVASVSLLKLFAEKFPIDVGQNQEVDVGIIDITDLANITMSFTQKGFSIKNPIPGTNVEFLHVNAAVTVDFSLNRITEEQYRGMLLRQRKICADLNRTSDVKRIDKKLADPSTFPDKLFQVKQISADGSFMRDVLMQSRLPDVTDPDYQREISGECVEQLRNQKNDNLAQICSQEMKRHKDELERSHRDIDIDSCASELGMRYLLKETDTPKQESAARKQVDENIEVRRTVRKYAMWQELRQTLKDQTLGTFTRTFTRYEKKLNKHKDSFGMRVVEVVGAIILSPLYFIKPVRNLIHSLWYTKSKDATTSVGRLVAQKTKRDQFDENTPPSQSPTTPKKRR